MEKTAARRGRVSTRGGVGVWRARRSPPPSPAPVHTSVGDVDRPLGVLVFLAAAKMSEPQLAGYFKMPNSQIVVTGHVSRPPQANLVRFRAWRLPYLGAPERWTAALCWFRGLNNFDPGPIDCVLSLELHSPSTLQAKRLADRLGVPHVVAVAEILATSPLYSLPPWRQITQTVSRSARAFVCCVDPARDHAVANGCAADSCTVISPGIDLERFFPKPGGRCAEPVLLFVGELREDKGIRDVLAAVERARKEIPDLRLIVVGDGPLRDELQSQTRQSGFVEYRGKVPRDELPEIYRQARTFILAPYSRPLWAEQFGFASVEAMGAGLPVVITNSGAVPEVVPHWNPICPQRDVTALTTGIVAAMGPSGDDWGVRNRQFAEERYDIVTQATRLRSWLGKLVSGSGRQ
jgi:glycosyltransferase involved in cell wall biosynthesis